MMWLDGERLPTLWGRTCGNWIGFASTWLVIVWIVRRTPTTSATTIKGHAAQRVITAWHFGWQPAQQASGADWLAPFQARLLNDPYGVVRYVAEHNLRQLPGFENFRYDFLANEEELQRNVEKVIERWRDNTGESISRTGDEICIDADGNVMEAKVSRLIQARDDRAVTIKE